MHSYTEVHTPIGKVIISADDHFITRLFLSEEQFEDYVQYHPMRQADDDHLLLKDAIKQLTEYFEGKRTSFSCHSSRQEQLFKNMFGLHLKRFHMESPVRTSILP
jgi:O6-methylguanine-DNA--protein-cysteine methyltransferase